MSPGSCCWPCLPSLPQEADEIGCHARTPCWPGMSLSRGRPLPMATTFYLHTQPMGTDCIAGHGHNVTARSPMLLPYRLGQLRFACFCCQPGQFHCWPGWMPAIFLFPTDCLHSLPVFFFKAAWEGCLSLQIATLRTYTEELTHRLFLLKLRDATPHAIMPHFTD